MLSIEETRTNVRTTNKVTKRLDFRVSWTPKTPLRLRPGPQDSTLDSQT